MSMIIRRVTKGGIKVTEAANGRGSPYVESPRGIPVTFVASGGIPVRQGVRVPAGYGALRIGSSPSAPLARVGNPSTSFRILIPRAA